MLKSIDELTIIKMQLRNQEINYKQAKILANPFIEDLNKKSIEIAKKYKLKPRLINFSSFMR